MTKVKQLQNENNSNHTNDVFRTKLLERIIAQKSWKNKHARYFHRPEMGGKASKTLEKIS